MLSGLSVLSNSNDMLHGEIAYRGHVVRKETAPLLGKEKMGPETIDMMKFYSSKWRSKSMFQVLLRYRAARYQDLVQFSQQVSVRSVVVG